ncbi:hypothetical protein [Streptomyces sp. NPDC005435]|uniref:hypothetical protein n=1 Tax=Streptomyces sp. NPDC005435 TaxID=3154464 RepID=UPI0034543216
MDMADKLDVTVYDIDWDLLRKRLGKPREPWDRMTPEDADHQLWRSRLYRETVSEQEYLTTDRDGHPLRIVLLKERPEAHLKADPGAVYEFASEPPQY